MRKLFGGRLATFFLTTICVAACLEPYTPPEVSATGNLLAIEGVVNTTDAVATVKISHPLVINSDDASKMETGAVVSIVTETGKSWQLPEISPGVYVVNGINIQPGISCHLTVTTGSGAQYESAVVEMTQTPAIDSVYFNYDDDGLEVLVDTHDDSGASHYYQWTYTETWEYYSQFTSYLKVVPGGIQGQSVIPRKPEEFASRCWRTVPSTQIIIASTQNLSGDVVSGKLLMSIPVGSQKVSNKYSMLVRQRVITEDEYIYLSQLQKTTENLGGLFDPQPSQVYGNIKRVSETGGTAIGYFSGGSYREKRVFKSFSDLPEHLAIKPSRTACLIDTICYNPPNRSPIRCVVDLANVPLTENIIGEIWQGINLVGYVSTSDACADCREQGGVLQKPEFW
ncbi:MAG TPA: DUF4249 domain-containing protein [Cyclobacteriaceae bacterium]|nr:DUF4249 domain-containing protein [Cyclobacteriaceae bacterium]